MKKIIIIPILTTFLTVGVAETRDVLHNFHTVETGKLYRSALLSPEALEQTIKQYKIKTVINLQGAHPDDEWYIKEKSLLKTLNVTLVDIPERTERIPTRDELRSLFQAFDSTERPILMHCNSGSDRTGEAAAIYEIEYMGKTKEEAMSELSLMYLHLPFLVPSKTYFMGLYKGKNWALNEYDPCKQKYLYFDQHRECQHVKLVGSSIALPKAKPIN